MHFSVVSLFPEFFSGPLDCGLMQRARKSGVISISLHNPRDDADNRHHTVDDRPYGGGPGMLMLPGPLSKTLQSLGHGPHHTQENRLIFLTPTGKPLTQSLARELVGSRSVTLVCGRYEGIDHRLESLFAMEDVSVGDFVLNGGEAAALCLMEAVARLLPGFMGHEQSGEEESFSTGLLEYPQYTRPEIFEGLAVPEVLRSGDHGRIAAWRREASLEITLQRRPELLSQASLSVADQAFLKSRPLESRGRNLYCALVHYPVLDKAKNSVAASLTNLDIHDIARSSCTYGLGCYYVLTPLQDQRDLLNSILAHWNNGPGLTSNPQRGQALSLVKGLAGIEDALADIRTRTGRDPVVLGTTARMDADTLPVFGFERIAELLEEQAVLMLFGTGQGLAPEALAFCRALAPPLRWHGAYKIGRAHV